MTGGTIDRGNNRHHLAVPSAGRLVRLSAARARLPRVDWARNRLSISAVYHRRMCNPVYPAPEDDHAPVDALGFSILLLPVLALMPLITARSESIAVRIDPPRSRSPRARGLRPRCSPAAASGACRRSTSTPRGAQRRVGLCRRQRQGRELSVRQPWESTATPRR